MIRISVIIPAYNASNLVVRAIDSVLEQTYKAHEIIIIDDGSTDDTELKLIKYGDSIRYIKQSNSGVSASRNRGIFEATGDWVAFLDADDEWLPEKLECQITILKDNPDLVWCSGLTKMLAANTNEYVNKQINQSLTHSQKQILDFTDACMDGIFFHTNTMIIKKDLFDSIGHFNEQLIISEDRDLWWRIAMRYPRIGFCCRALSLYYLDTPDSLIKSTKDRTQSFSVVIDNIQYATQVNTVESNKFVSFASALAYNYMLRFAMREIKIDKVLIKKSTDSIQVPLLKKYLIVICTVLPKRLARILINTLYRTSILKDPFCSDHKSSRIGFNKVKGLIKKQ